MAARLASPKRMLPEVGETSRASTLARLWAPEPLSPMSATLSVSSNWKVTPSRVLIPPSSSSETLVATTGPERCGTSPSPGSCTASSSSPAGWNWSTIWSYLTRVSSFCWYQASSSFHGSDMSL